MTYRKFLSVVLISALTIIGIIAGVNYTIDPLCTFSHSNFLNNKQVDFDERQQKTNYLYFVNHDFDSILLGSSRTTYIDQHLFGSEKVFNYGANNMTPYEYDQLIKNFIEITGHVPKKIYIGIDFFGTNVYRSPIQDRNLLSESKKSGYRFKKLVSLELFKYSLKNIRQNFKAKKPYYTRNNVKNIPKNYIELSQKNILKTSRSFEKYEYDKNLSQCYSQLKEKYKDSEFVIFTTPIYYKRLSSYEKSGLDQYYLQWLQETVHVFGEVNHFMYYSEFSMDSNNYFDASHFKPDKAHLIVNSILNKKDNQYMIILEEENIESFISNFPQHKK